ncbi:VRR-NUC domain-containing protein [Eubacteriales bacterium OttesenSCG-928-A19]|nr:VRR-NUC domain-containing protein [Eubacteriales bacterium OttesenSCG-928-A19]
MKRATHATGALPVATEEQEQAALFEWADIQKCAYPELGLLYHVPNEGKRSPRTGARMRAAGLRKGVPDVCLPVARNGSHALYIELKSRRKGAKATPEQEDWIDALREQGNEAALCYGAAEAIQTIMRYLTGRERA